MQSIHSISTKEVIKKLPITFQFAQFVPKETLKKKSKTNVSSHKYSTHYKPITKMRKP
jgi:hypothetical protein